MGDGGPLQIACFLVGTYTFSGAIDETMVPDSTKMDMLYVVAGTAKWVRDVACERFRLHGDKDEFFRCWRTKWRRNVVPQDKTGKFLRQVSPTQSHQSNGAAEKAVSTVRGLARTNLAVLKDKSRLLTWRHIHRCCRGHSDTRMTPYDKIR